MKTPYAIGAVVTAVLITVLIEESRISKIRHEGQPQATPTATAANTGTQSGDKSGPEPRETPANRTNKKPSPAPKPPETDTATLAKTARKMWDSPAGRSMMNQGVKIAVTMMYDDFIKGLDLTKEEAEYFGNLLGNEMSRQQEIGMKLMGASAEERKTLTDEMKRVTEETDAAIRKFLNDDEDYNSFTAYKDRLPERQQISGIRATMESKGAPLDAATETRLVEAMFKARTETAAPDLSGPGALEEMAKGTLTETFERTWQAQQDTLRTQTTEFLTQAQQAAFEEYQKSMKEMQLMSLKLAEKMLDEGKPKTP
ncbi:MAG: hypothetical protein J0M04_04765 [Verrucomicrobia bacterium]|nr:hypothetical protein [Verrucomicrobiota bacterium]